MTNKKHDVEEIVDHKVGVFIVQMNDQFERVLEGVKSITESVKTTSRTSERIEKIEHEITKIKLDTSATYLQVDLIKARSAKILEELEEIKNSLQDQGTRITTLEQSTA